MIYDCNCQSPHLTYHCRQPCSNLIGQFEGACDTCLWLLLYFLELVWMFFLYSFSSFSLKNVCGCYSKLCISFPYIKSFWVLIMTETWVTNATTIVMLFVLNISKVDCYSIFLAHKCLLLYSPKGTLPTYLHSLRVQIQMANLCWRSIADTKILGLRLGYCYCIIVLMCHHLQLLPRQFVNLL